jgi:hypothetical protein
MAELSLRDAVVFGNAISQRQRQFVVQLSDVALHFVLIFQMNYFA